MKLKLCVFQLIHCPYVRDSVLWWLILMSGTVLNPAVRSQWFRTPRPGFLDADSVRGYLLYAVCFILSQQRLFILIYSSFIIIIQNQLQEGCLSLIQNNAQRTNIFKQLLRFLALILNRKLVLLVGFKA